METRPIKYSFDFHYIMTLFFFSSNGIAIVLKFIM